MSISQPAAHERIPLEEGCTSGGSSALKRTDEEKEDPGSSSLGNFYFQILFSCVTADTLRCSEGEIHLNVFLESPAHRNFQLKST